MIDSHPATWSYNSQSGGSGFTWIYGYEGSPATLSVAALYQQWEANSGMNELVGVPGSDPDGDSLPNWLEQGLGTDPLHATPPIQAEIRFSPDGRPGIRYWQPKGGSGTTGIDYSVRGVRFSVEASATLAGGDWLHDAEVLEALATEIVDRGDGTEDVSVYWKESAPEGFLRLRMTDEFFQDR